MARRLAASAALVALMSGCALPRAGGPAASNPLPVVQTPAATPNQRGTSVAARTSVDAGTAVAAADPAAVAAADPAASSPPDTRHDPVSAAVAFVTDGQQLIDAGPRIVDALAGVIDPSATDLTARIVGRAAALHEALRSATGPVACRQAVLAVRVRDRTDQAATIELWWVGELDAPGAAQPQASWTTSTLTLVQRDGLWLVSDESTLSGPTPLTAAGSPPLSAAELEGTLEGFTPWPAR